MNPELDRDSEKKKRNWNENIKYAPVCSALTLSLSPYHHVIKY